jgi:hypothetical protein
MLKSVKMTLKRLNGNQSGLAMVEFAISLPFFVGLTVGGVEIANYASVVMRLNQIALHTADNAARIGTTTALGNKVISEVQIKDVFEGAMRAGEQIALGGSHSYVANGQTQKRGNTLIILSSFEQVAAFDPVTPLYRIRWQRCGGGASFYKSNYGDPAKTDSATGIGPTGRQVSPPPDGSLMFVELQYYFKPMIVNGFSPLTDRTINQVASMVVRDARDTTSAPSGDGIYNIEGVEKATC